MSTEPKVPIKVIACNGANCPIRFGCGKFFRMNYADKCHEIIKAPIIKDQGGKAECPLYERI